MSIDPIVDIGIGNPIAQFRRKARCQRRITEIVRVGRKARYMVSDDDLILSSRFLNAFLDKFKRRCMEFVVVINRDATIIKVDRSEV